MNFIRKLSSGLRPFGSTFGLQSDLDDGGCEGARSIQRLAIRLIDSMFAEQKIEAMIQIGHISYVGGKEPTSAAVKWMPYFVEIIQNPKYANNGNVQVASLQAMCEICHYDKNAKEFVMFSRANIEMFRDLIGKTETQKDVRVGRWACYLLAMCITGKVKLMLEIMRNEELTAALITAADYNSPPWTGWSMNMADLILKLLHHRDPAIPVSPL